MNRELTGRDVLFITVGAFAVIITVNFVMAWQAVSTFPGLEVKNGYIASQHFEANRKAQVALGWDVQTTLRESTLQIRFTDADGQPAEVASISGLLGRTTSQVDDQIPNFSQVEDAVFEADVQTANGQWVLKLNAVADDGTAFSQRVSLTVRDP